MKDQAGIQTRAAHYRWYNNIIFVLKDQEKISDLVAKVNMTNFWKKKTWKRKSEGQPEVLLNSRPVSSLKHQRVGSYQLMPFK